MLELAIGILEGKRKADFVRQYEEVIESVTPRDLIFVVDGIVKQGAKITKQRKTTLGRLSVFEFPCSGKPGIGIQDESH